MSFKIGVIGAGIFGVTTAWKLASLGYKVDLYEKENDILKAASGINQYRLHKGYHYPRSDETALDCKHEFEGFKNEYKDCLFESDNYYCLSKRDSKVSKEEFLNFCKKHNLSIKEKFSPVVKKEAISFSVKPEEYLINVKKLHSLCWKKLENNKVNVIFKEWDNKLGKNYDYLIYALYANSNHPFSERFNHQRDYQFELCEKLVLKLPEEYKDQSVVILDGKFMCIDPMGDTDYHVMGNVVHAIHNTNIGKFPILPQNFKHLLNKGIIKDPSITNFDKFVNSAKEYFINIEKAIHIGSMYTFRTVLPNHDHDDARPTLVNKISNKEFSIFSGKIGTCVKASNLICKEIQERVTENQVKIF